MSRRDNELYAFEEFRLDPVRRVLQRDGETIAVTPKAFETLLALIEGRHRVMDKDELMRRVWPDAIVEEVGLAKNISALRKALGERTGEHRFIVTVPGRGYRFVADVTVIPSATAPEASPDEWPAAPVIDPAARPTAPAAGTGVLRSAGLLLALGVIVMVAILATGYVAGARRAGASALTTRDTILLAGFVNRTGEPVFDDTLEQGLAAQLEQSPFLNLFPAEGAQRTLRLLGHPADRPMTRAIATEVCRREGLKAFVSGTIAPVGRHYAITLEAIDQNGGTMAREQVEAEGKEGVLRALSQAAGRLRQRLGESIGSVRAFDADVTTASLDALKAYTEGGQFVARGKWRESIPLYQRATELDPHFASAFASLGLSYANSRQLTRAADAMRTAYALRDRASAYERARIVHFYHLNVTGDAAGAVDTLEKHRQTYPRDGRSYTGLALVYIRVGQYEKAVEAARQGLRLNPDTPVLHLNLTHALLRLNRYDEASQVIAQARGRLKLETARLGRSAFEIAFARGDDAAMQRELDALIGTPSEFVAFSLQSEVAMFSGRWRQSGALARRAIDLAASRDEKGPAGRIAMGAAARAAEIGQCPRAVTLADEALALESNELSMPFAARVLARCGEARRARALIDETSTRYPVNTTVQAIWLPIARAAIALQGDTSAGAREAIDLLQSVTPYQPAAEFWPQYLRGHAYLRLQKGADAAAEFRAILGSRSHSAMSVLYPLAHLGLARAAVMTGDASTARKAYDDLFALWKDAETELIPLMQARVEARARHTD